MVFPARRRPLPSRGSRFPGPEAGAGKTCNHPPLRWRPRPPLSILAGVMARARPSPARPGNAFRERFSAGKALLGMVHLSPLPGSPGYRGEAIEEIVARALKDARALLEGGMDGYLLENFGDAPFFRDQVLPHVLTLMTRIALALPSEGAGERRPLRGVNVLRNDALGALSVSAAAALHLIRVSAR